MESSLLLDRYVIQEPLGQGASGVVNLAWDTRIQRNVAIKRIPLPQHSNEAAIPGLEEARTGAQLSDSRIVNVIDFEIEGDEALLIMEFVDGISLGTLMDRIPRMLNLDEVASIVQNVGKALAHAHRNHVLHLDVKPDNILIDLGGHSKVTDFGVGRLASAAGFGNATGGTIGYMPPEQLRGQAVDEKTDQWAFAAMVYELLVGEDPFIADTFDRSLELIMRSEIALPSSIDDEIDPEVDDIIFRALSIDPQKRYASVGRFASELLAHLGSPKDGRARLGKLVGLFGDEIALGSPEDRMRALKRIEQDPAQASAWQMGSAVPEDDDLSDVRPGQQLTIDYDDETDGYDDGYGDEADDGALRGGRRRRAPDSYDERRMVPRRRHRPWRDAVNAKTARVVERVLGGAANGALSAVAVYGALVPCLQSYLGGWAHGVPATWLPAVVVLAATATGAVIPRVGPLVSLGLMSCGMLVGGWVPQGAILALIAVVWWAFLGRLGNAESNCAVIGPALGLLGLGYVQPLAAGWLFRGAKALFTAMFGAMLMLVIAPVTGCSQIFRISTSFMDHTVANDLFSTNAYNSPELWITVVGWVVAALAMSLLANRGSKGFTLAGVVAGGAIMGISRVLGLMARGMQYGLLSTETLVAVVVPVLIMCVVTWLHTPPESSRLLP